MQFSRKQDALHDTEAGIGIELSGCAFTKQLLCCQKAPTDRGQIDGNAKEEGRQAMSNNVALFQSLIDLSTPVKS